MPSNVTHPITNSTQATAANAMAPINDLDSAIGTGSFNAAPDGTTPTDSKTAANKLSAAIGLLSGFAGGAYASVQAAFNALKTRQDTSDANTSANTTAIGAETLVTPPDGSSTTGLSLRGIANKFSASIGLLSALTTTAKTSIVNAVNELKTRADTNDTVVTANTNAIGSGSLNTAPDGTTPGDLKSASNKLAAAIGLLSGFAGGTYTSVQQAFNALKNRADVSLNSDGTLKNNAVTSAAQVTDGALTNADMATDIKPGSLAALLTTAKDSLTNALNEVFNIASALLTTAPQYIDDPLQQNTDPTVLDNGDGFAPFSSTTVAGVKYPQWSIAPNTVTSLYGGIVFMMPAGVNDAAWYVRRKDLNLATGATLEFAADATTDAAGVTAGVQAQLRVTQYQANGTASTGGGTTIGSYGTLNASTATTMKSGQLPTYSDMDYIGVIVHRNGSTAGNVFIHAHWGNPNAATSRPSPSFNPRAIIADFIASRTGGDGTKYQTQNARLNVIERPSLGDDAMWGRKFLRSYQDKIAALQAGTLTGRLIIVGLGDSWLKRSGFLDQLRSALQTHFNANGGYGYASFVQTADGGAYTDTNITVSSTGGWTIKDGNAGGTQDPTALGPDMLHIFSNTVGSTYTLALANWVTDNIEIHYYRQAGGGTFTVQDSLNGGSFTTLGTIDTNASGGYTVTPYSLSSGQHTIKITVTVAGTAGVTAFGPAFYKGTTGIVIHRLGNASSKVADWNSVNQSNLQAAITAFSPDMVLFLDGTNDMDKNIYPPTYGVGVGTMVDLIRAGAPLADVLLIASGDNNIVGRTYNMAQYSDAMAAVAVAKSCAFASIFKMRGAYAAANSRGEYADQAHLTAATFQLIASLIYSGLLGTGY